MDAGGGGSSECEGPTRSNFPRPETFRPWLPVSARPGVPSVDSRSPEARGLKACVHLSARRRLPPRRDSRGLRATFPELGPGHQLRPGAGWSLLRFRAGENAPHSETTGERLLPPPRTPPWLCTALAGGRGPASGPGGAPSSGDPRSLLRLSGPQFPSVKIRLWTRQTLRLSARPRAFGTPLGGRDGVSCLEFRGCGWGVSGVARPPSWGPGCGFQR